MGSKVQLRQNDHNKNLNRAGYVYFEIGMVYTYYDSTHC